ncbi:MULTISPECIES: hypothetical protein [Agromyces]|jgi:hypothetical protein|uniref:hypothetical protein n=1 Tax=Agromyces TaxID=33877 RepID=UPI00203CC72F|nr:MULTISPECIES: hypothetical protein [Agromyces]MCM3658218.1 hypothetical protein [Agromyces mediolanus]GLU88056.1 hypothetical protein Agsp01_03110 [Agromyces sp. NBRC 114283]
MPIHTGRRRVLPILTLCIGLSLAAPLPAQAAPGESAVIPASSVIEVDTPSSPAPDHEQRAQAATIRLVVLAGVFGVVFLGIGIAFFRMIRRNRLD